jgi:hypothetical protein
MGHPTEDDSRPPEQEQEWGHDEIRTESTATRQDTTTSEKHDHLEKDPETTQAARNGQSTHIDEAVAARIAENVDDFMVNIYTLVTMFGV